MMTQSLQKRTEKETVFVKQNKFEGFEKCKEIYFWDLLNKTHNLHYVIIRVYFHCRTVYK